MGRILRSSTKSVPLMTSPASTQGESGKHTGSKTRKHRKPPALSRQVASSLHDQRRQSTRQEIKTASRKNPARSTRKDAGRSQGKIQRPKDVVPEGNDSSGDYDDDTLQPSPSASPPFPFLHLPRELRDLIYDNIIRSGKHHHTKHPCRACCLVILPISQQFQDQVRWRHLRHYFDLLDSSIPSTCRQIRTEFLSAFFPAFRPFVTLHAWPGQKPRDTVSTFEQWMGLIGPISAAQIRHLDVQFGFKDATYRSSILSIMRLDFASFPTKLAFFKGPGESEHTDAELTVFAYTAYGVLSRFDWIRLSILEREANGGEGLGRKDVIGLARSCLKFGDRSRGFSDEEIERKFRTEALNGWGIRHRQEKLGVKGLEGKGRAIVEMLVVFGRELDGLRWRWAGWELGPHGWVWNGGGKINE
ncbi:hypothetical protein K490DRAFT_65230 [Saccharata proteae CBS 121410]|uniref:F-box domain-containing protein n=1 Tax=Saccharata proteae CBS 121410 TaxID=1314787 RepID=A0A9P4HZ93_9PEZI|nr:hypothetical protein K490DRAFT_65230 [Saccharata proteae CBS 121410]